MPYFVKEKFHISDLLPAQDTAKSIALVEPEEYLANLYRRYLTLQGYAVTHYQGPRHVPHVFLTAMPDVLILNSEVFEKVGAAVEKISDVLQLYPHLLVVTIGYNTQADDLQKLMSAGIASHINRKLSKPQDLVDVVRAVLHKTQSM